jgi:histidine triad (HIT) family protein
MPEQMTEEQRKELEEKLKNMSPEELAQFQKQQCIFCQIISGKVPSTKVYEDEHSITILDINPAAKGHLLLIPKEHYVIMPQVPDNIITHLYLVAQKLSNVLLRSLKLSGTNIFVANGLVAGQKAQHFMMHIIPRKEGDGLFKLEEKILDKEMLSKIQGALQDKINGLFGVSTQTKLIEEKEEPGEVEEKPKKTKKPRKKKVPVEEPEEEVEDDDGEEEGTSLDDIASLFT